jgi:pilus assembly protein CpaB
MRSKLIIVVLAIALGGVAAFAAYSYLSGVQRAAEAGSTMTDVLVATQDIPRGTSANELMSSGAVQLVKMPLRYIASGAISSVTSVADRILAVPVSKGEVLTTARFQYPSEAGLAFNVPKGLVAVTIPVDDSRGVAGLVKPGDRVALLATVATKSGQGDQTRIAIPGARVLAVGRSTGAESPKQTSSQGGGLTGSQNSQPQSANTVTLALSPADAERVVFVAESGRLWLALLPTTESSATPGPGQTAATVLK